jgi:hypothetical protein
VTIYHENEKYLEMLELNCLLHVRITLKPILGAFFMSAEDRWNWCPVTAFGVSGVEPSGSATGVS